MHMGILTTLVVVLVAGHAAASSEPVDSWAEVESAMLSAKQALQSEFDAIDNLVLDTRDYVNDLARQTMQQQFFVEERIRSEGDSGVKVVRGGSNGPANYYGYTHIGASFNAIHEHSDILRAIGMGEISAVLNGVDFRTRHNDYSLVMPSTTSKEYNAVEEIPFPDVPREVSSKSTVQEQVEEMRQWFKAFKEQDHSVRDYRKYFKPVLCYMEGAWTTDTKDIVDFQSKLNKIDAKSIRELQERVRYMSASGSKDRKENYAYLPTTIMDVDNASNNVTYGQWNYRILCNPIKQDIPTSYFKQMEDFSYRYPQGKELSELTDSRAARFRLYEPHDAQFTQYSLMDQIFSTVPGKDNIPAPLTEDGLGETLYSMDGSDKVLNTAYYHRWFKFGDNAAVVGVSPREVAQGFNDENLWVAQTTQPRVAPATLRSCLEEMIPGKGKQRVCKKTETRYSYAIPLEIIYLTPLLGWNPYDITVYPDWKSARGSDKKAWAGAHKSYYYRTPVEIFKRCRRESVADSGHWCIHIKDSAGKPQHVAASGIKIVPEIRGVGRVRLRYPIAPVHGEGSSVWKELNAFRDMIMNGDISLKDAIQQEGPPTNVLFEMSYTVQDPPGEHTHEFTVSWADFKAMRDDRKHIEVSTSVAQGHTHLLTIRYNYSAKSFEYTKCHGQRICWDKHPTVVNILSNSEFIESAMKG